MVNRIVATLAEFEQMADTLQDMATAAYLSATELVPKLIIMGCDSDAEVQPAYRWSSLEIMDMLTENAGDSGPVILATVIEKLVTDPEVLIVGYASEAWATKYALAEREQLGDVVYPEESPNRTELVVLSMQSANQVAIKALPLYRDGLNTKLGTAALMFRPYVPPATAHYVQ